jgi:poly(A) polymerase
MENMKEPNLTLSKILEFSKAQGLALYLVGGWVRDELLGINSVKAEFSSLGKPINVDIAICKDALDVSRKLAAHLKGTYVCLDEKLGSARVVVKSSDVTVEIDISDFRAKTIEEDLRLRDFTINAIALPLEAYCNETGFKDSLIDPLRGTQDLKERIIRACFEGTFLDDPIRILRAFRFALSLSFSLDERLKPLMGEALGGLGDVSGERIRDELFAMFHTDNSNLALKELDSIGVLGLLFPELTPARGMDQGGYHHLDVLGHELETVFQADRFLGDLSEFSQIFREPISAYCQECLVEGRSRKALIKLAGLLHDIGKPATKRVEKDGDIWFIGHDQFGATLIERIANRLKLSTRESQLLEKLVLYHLRPGHLSREVELTRRAVFRFFRDLGDDGPACLLLWWADRMATRGPASKVNQIDQQRLRLEELFHAYFFKPEEVVHPPRLIDGNDLMKIFKVKPGPVIGKILKFIEEAQAEGKVSNIEEALGLAKQLLSDPDFLKENQ